MAGFTPNYNMAYFDFGDVLNDPINTAREVDRFLFIDKQIYGLYSIFGNGVISGWEVTDATYSHGNGISVSISSGTGIVSLRASETVVPTVLDYFPSNSILYIYATHSNPDMTTKNFVNFSYSSDSNLTTSVKLAKIVTGDNAITSIDNTDRDYVIVDQQISSLILSHRHRGYPTKINLDTNTKNRVSGAKIESFDANKINSGRFGLDRIPLLNHNTLINRGVLTHAQLDTYVQNFDSTNLLGEVAAANRMLQSIYLKKLYPNIDEFFINELIFIAGISPTSFYDPINSTATVDSEASTIAGFPFGGTTAYFFTKSFTLPGPIVKCFVAADSDVVSDGSISFGLTLSNSTVFSEYTALTVNSVNTINEDGTSMRIGVELTSPTNLYTHDPYATAFIDYVDFEFTNDDDESHDFHFRIRFYTDDDMTILYQTAFSEDDQEGWIINDDATIPVAGFPVPSGEEAQITYYPDASDFTTGITYYMVIDIWDGESFTAGGSGFTFVSSGPDSDEKYESIPRVNGFSFIFELEDGQKVMLNS